VYTQSDPVTRVRLHESASCHGNLVRVYERPLRASAVIPLGYVCSVCRAFELDEEVVKAANELRPAIEAIAVELTTLLLDRQTHERFAGIVRSNEELIAAVQQGNPFLQGVRRWWATSAALTLRRHLESGSTNGLRGAIEALSNLECDGSPAADPGTFATDLERLERIADRFRPYLNTLIHGAAIDPFGSSLTFNELNEAISSVGDIAQRAYAAITNVSRRMDVVVQYDWTAIFKRPWIQDDTEMAYVLGKPGVPYDALPMSAADAKEQARLLACIELDNYGSGTLRATNVGKQSALDVRVFLPYARTVIDVNEIAPGDSTSRVLSPELTATISGQAVFEFADVHDRVYRQYANVDFPTARMRKLDETPYRVSGRIVDPAVFGVR
jgi:hypothetical protein